MVDHSSKLPANSEVPPGPERTGAVGAPVKGAGKGKHARIDIKTGKVISMESIIESARTMLTNNRNVGDIKRELVQAYGGKGTSFHKHIALARRRNRKNLGRTPEQAKSDSTEQWVRLMSDERVKRALAIQEVAEAKAKLKVAEAAYDDATPAQYQMARDRLDVAIGNLERAEKSLASAKYWIAQHQHTIDRILGNLAPIEYKDTSEKKAELASPPEPITDKESDSRLEELLLKARGEIKAEISTPSAN